MAGAFNRDIYLRDNRNHSGELPTQILPEGSRSFRASQTIISRHYIYIQVEIRTTGNQSGQNDTQVYKNFFVEIRSFETYIRAPVRVE